MKNELKISTLSIVCVLCATAFSSAYGASTVRTLGGAGTYNSVSAASTSNSGVARAGVARVTPASGRVTSVAKPSGATSTTSGTASRVSAAPRLSLGKYLGGTTNVNRPSGSTGGNGSSNPGLSSADIADLQSQIDKTQEDLEKALDAVDKLKTTVDSIAIQGVVAQDGYISIDDNGMAYLNVQELGTNSVARVSEDGKTLTIRIGTNGTPFSVDLPDLLSSDDMNAKLEEKLATYVTKQEFKELKDAVDLLDSDGAELTEKLSGKADKLTTGNYTVGNVATVGADGQYVDGGVLLENLATHEDLKTMGVLNENGQVVNKFETLKAEITNNMTEILQEDLSFTEVKNGKLVIKENSITSTELAPNSVTDVELANGAVQEENLAKTITKQLIGDGYTAATSAPDNNSGYAVMLVDKNGSKKWVPLELADTTETPTETGGNDSY